MSEAQKNHPLDSIAGIQPVRAIGGTLALAGFTIALLCGLHAGNPVETIVFRSLGSMACCLIMGLIAGRFCDVAITEYMTTYLRSQDVPQSDMDVIDLALQLQQERYGGQNLDNSTNAKDIAEIVN